MMHTPNCEGISTGALAASPTLAAPMPLPENDDGPFQASFLGVRVPNVPPVNTPPARAGGAQLKRKSGLFF